MFYLLIFLIFLGLIVLLQPRWFFKIIDRVFPGATYFFETNDRVIALTIDDGLDSATTPKILEILAKHQVHATFFLISSRVEPNPSLMSELVQQGHEVGNHLTQDEWSILLAPSEFEASVVEAHNVLSKFAQPQWLRPAGGWYKKSTIDIAHKHNYRVALGDIFPFDTHIPSSWFATQYILWKVRPGSIVILHDSGMWGKRTATTLEKVLPVLDRRGYRAVTLSDLLNT
jgi:peptidoglycan-N-acetylglucosamine deacetylase